MHACKHVSHKHKDQYLKECSLRYNLRREENGTPLARLLDSTNGRQTYKIRIGTLTDDDTEAG